MNLTKRKIELLAPAKNLELGTEAIKHGADAVYIGAEKFGARSAVGNSVEDIAELIRFAHKFNAKVYVTINTILFDEELNSVEKLILQLYKIGTDAIIFQDMALLEMDLPPIPLFASTQTNNYELERIQMLEAAGVSRIILARELSNNQITEISKNTNADLEFFIHGALCVCFSGQCYMSHAITGKSANRGECTQPCRAKYNLIDAEGNYLQKNKHLLSLKDMNQTENLETLIEAGITSFKIEGRLKDKSYVKNVVAFYRNKLNKIIESRNDLIKSSSGNIELNFDPKPEKVFNREFTDYFFKSNNNKLANFNSAKPMGEYIGSVEEINNNRVRIKSPVKLSNGDGICFINNKGEVVGTQLNKVEGNWLELNSISGLRKGIKLFRNHDKEFQKEMNKETSRRLIDAEILISGDKNKFEIVITDEDGTKLKKEFNSDSEADNYEVIKNKLQAQFSKSGDSLFRIKNIKVESTSLPYLKTSEMNQFRREIFKELEELRLNDYKREIRKPGINKNFNVELADYKLNITNKLARQFYEKAEIKNFENGFELQNNFTNKDLMISKYCILREIDLCKKETGKKIKEPLYLENNGQYYLLEFDCNRCEMNIKLK